MSYPNITVQMPVYKEGLEAVILPSIISLEVRADETGDEEPLRDGDGKALLTWAVAMRLLCLVYK